MSSVHIGMPKGEHQYPCRYRNNHRCEPDSVLTLSSKVEFTAERTCGLRDTLIQQLDPAGKLLTLCNGRTRCLPPAAYKAFKQTLKLKERLVI